MLAHAPADAQARAPADAAPADAAPGRAISGHGETAATDAAAQPPLAIRDTASARPRKPEPRGGKAQLRIAAIPWATISINGKSYGNTPKSIELPANTTLNIVLTNPDLDRSKSFKRRLEPDDNAEIVWKVQ